MKKITFFFTFILIAFGNSAFSQGNINYQIRIINHDQEPIPNLEIKAFEITSFRVVKAKTDKNGQAFLRLNESKEWSVSIGGMKDYLKIKAVPYSVVDRNETIVYDMQDYNRKKLQDKNRVNDNYKIIKSTAKRGANFSEPNCFLTVRITHPYTGQKVSNLVVRLVNSRDSVIYTAKTDHLGNAYFIVPNKTNYDIDINSFKNYNYFDVGDEFISHTLLLQFAPSDVNEKTINDTIYQRVAKNSKPSSERIFLKVIVRGGKRNGQNETVYLRNLKTGKVYTTKTDANSCAYFKLPFGHIYMVDFKNQKNADVINLELAKTLTKAEVHVLYSPDPRLEYPERYIPTPDRLMTKAFNDFLDKQFEKPKDKPFVLKIFSAKKINANSREALFHMEFSSSDSYGNNIRKPLNVSFVLDKSGSMQCCGRTESLKKSLWSLGNTLQNDDVVSIVLFDNVASSVQHTTKDHLSGIEVVIENYRPGGSTNIFEGLQLGIEDIMKGYDPKKSNRIILLTDGYGVTPPQTITNYVSDKFNEGIEFSTIGLGQDFNRSLLELIADKGYGTFNYVDSSTNLNEIFLDEVKKSMFYTATDLKVEFFYDKQLIFSKLYGYPIHSTTDNSASFEIKKVPLNVNEIAFLKFKLENPDSSIESKPIKVKVSYFDLVKNKEVSYEEEIKLEWTEETDTELNLDQHEKKLYAIAIMNQSLKVMAEAYASDQPDKAEESLRQGIEQIEEIFPDSKPKDVKELFDEAHKYVRLFEQMRKNEDQ